LPLFASSEIQGRLSFFSDRPEHLPDRHFGGKIAKDFAGKTLNIVGEETQPFQKNVLIPAFQGTCIETVLMPFLFNESIEAQR
jgi:hypothetical protein